MSVVGFKMGFSLVDCLFQTLAEECGDFICHIFAYCDQEVGLCICPEGFEGDGIEYCNQLESTEATTNPPKNTTADPTTGPTTDLTTNPSIVCGDFECHMFAFCNEETLTCMCLDGYTGDGVESCLPSRPTTEGD